MNFKHFRMVVSGLAAGLVAVAAFDAGAADKKDSAAPQKKPAAQKYAGPKNWTQFGELQVAASKRLMPQISELASQAKFTLLPMLVQQALAASEPAMNFGAANENMDLGAKFYFRGRDFKNVALWPLAKGGVEAWKKANPGKDVKGSAFSGDGQWAFLSDDAALSKLAATKASPFSAPLKKGLLRITIDGRELLDNIESIVGEGMHEFAEVMGQKADGQNDQALQALGRLCRDLNSIRATLGVSTTGVDLRIKAVPREGGDLDAPPRGLEDWELMFAKTNGWDMISFVGESAKKQPTVRKEIIGELSKAIAEYKSAKEPVFAMRQIIELSEKKGEATIRLWVFCWRDSGVYKLIVRLPKEAVALVFSSMVQMGPPTTGEAPAGAENGEQTPAVQMQMQVQPAPKEGGSK